MLDIYNYTIIYPNRQIIFAENRGKNRQIHRKLGRVIDKVPVYRHH